VGCVDFAKYTTFLWKLYEIDQQLVQVHIDIKLSWKTR